MKVLKPALIAGFIFFMQSVCCQPDLKIIPAAERTDDYFLQLLNKKVALVANQTSRIGKAIRNVIVKIYFGYLLRIACCEASILYTSRKSERKAINRSPRSVQSTRIDAVREFSQHVRSRMKWHFRIPVASLLISAAAAAQSAGPAPRLDAWKIIGPGGGGTMISPTISPHDPAVVVEHCDMTGSYITLDGGQSWRMFNLSNT